MMVAHYSGRDCPIQECVDRMRDCQHNHFVDPVTMYPILEPEQPETEQLSVKDTLGISIAIVAGIVIVSGALMFAFGADIPALKIARVEAAAFVAFWLSTLLVD